MTTADKLCANLVAAETRWLRADTGPRRAGADRSRKHWMDRLVEYVQRDASAPEELREHFRVVGPTYYAAAAAWCRKRGIV